MYIHSFKLKTQSDWGVALVDELFSTQTRGHEFRNPEAILNLGVTAGASNPRAESQKQEVPGTTRPGSLSWKGELWVQEKALSRGNMAEID